MTNGTTTALERVNVFSHEFVVALMNLDLYSPTSVHVQTNLQNLLYELGAWIASGGCDPLRLDIQQSRLIHDGETLLGSTLQAGRFITLCEEQGIQSISIEGNTDGGELLRFLLVLGSQRDKRLSPQDLHKYLELNGIKHIRVNQGEQVPGWQPGVDESHSHFTSSGRSLGFSSFSSSSQGALQDYQAMATCLHDSHVAASRGKELELERVSGLVEMALQNMDEDQSGLLSLATYDEIDSFTIGHSVRVALLTLQVARAAHAKTGDLIRAGTAALLHDVGKSRIPQEILFKRSSLTLEEREIMSQHSRLGGEILLEQDHLDPTAIGAAFCHHMTPNGLGYPSPAIPFEPSGVSKLVRVCDVFEALTAVRPYKKALSPIEAHVVMFREKGGFDPDWLRFFAHVVGLYPQGTRLTLNTGETAIVVGPGPGPTEPRVRITRKADGQLVPLDEQQEFVISEVLDGVEREIQVAQTSRLTSPETPKPHDPAHDGILSCCGEDLLKPQPEE